MDNTSAMHAAAASTLARAFAFHVASGGSQPVLVGGAAVQLLTAGTFASGDLDFVVSGSVEGAMRRAGFVAEHRAGMLHVGWYHPLHPMHGFQAVSGSLMDGRASYDRLIRLNTQHGPLMLPSVEDLVADRLGQHAVSSPTDDSRLLQASLLLALSGGVEPALLARRIEEEGGDPSLAEASTRWSPHPSGGMGLEDIWEERRNRAAALGMDVDAMAESLRNTGEMRTPEKVVLLEGVGLRMTRQPSCP